MQFVYCVVFLIVFVYVYCRFILPLLIFNDTVVFCNIVYIYHGHVEEQFCILNMFLPCLNKDIIIILPAQPQDLILLQFLLLLLLSSSFFFFFLSTSLFLLQLTWYDHVTQVIFISLMTATKLMGLEIHLGSFGVTGVKKVNHVKNMKTALI